MKRLLAPIKLVQLVQLIENAETVSRKGWVKRDYVISQFYETQTRQVPSRLNVELALHLYVYLKKHY